MKKKKRENRKIAYFKKKKQNFRAALGALVPLGLQTLSPHGLTVTAKGLPKAMPEASDFTFSYSWAKLKKQRPQ